jgi:hypothetical protein
MRLYDFNMPEINEISAYQKNISPEMNDRIDELERTMKAYPQKDCPVNHMFTPGLYTRQIYMPENTLIVSMIHKTTHPFVITQGIVHVKINDGEWKRLEAPYWGVTHAGTRRVLFIEKATTWGTFHPTDKTTVEEVMEDIIEKHEINLLDNEN